jgi:hypothetical protein
MQHWINVLFYDLIMLFDEYILNCYVINSIFFMWKLRFVSWAGEVEGLEIGGFIGRESYGGYNWGWDEDWAMILIDVIVIINYFFFQ